MISAHGLARSSSWACRRKRPVPGDQVLAYVAPGDADSGKAAPCQPAESSPLTVYRTERCCL